jgi:hypothetical protein
LSSVLYIDLVTGYFLSCITCTMIEKENNSSPGRM